MPKNSQKWDEEKYKRYVKEGRGQGEGVDYKPWFNIEDFSSEGFSTKAPGWKTNRSHEFASKHELRYYYLLEWSDIVTDVWEQFPLLDIEAARKIADDIGVKYPIDKESKTPYVLTTDFMISLNQNGQKTIVARTVKLFMKLEEKGVLEKLEIERRYWKDRGIDWAIVTENEIPTDMANNIEWVHPYYNLDPDDEIDLTGLPSIISLLKTRLHNYQHRIVTITDSVDNDMHLIPGTALKVLRHLIARKEVLLDMTKRIKVANASTVINGVVFDRKQDGLVNG
jgi:hypothetical protein